MTRLPGILADIADVAGEAAALQLMASHGGDRVDFPAHFRPGCWLEKAIGEKAARAVIDHYRVLDADGRAWGLKAVIIPIGDMGTIGRARSQARIAFFRARGEGCSVREARRRAGISDTTAWELHRKMKGSTDDPQGSLF